MKHLNRFLSEGDTDTTKPHLVDEEEGKDDKKFLAIMGEYKQSRKDSSAEGQKAAAKLFDKAMKLGTDGDVSKRAKLAAAYL